MADAAPLGSSLVNAHTTEGVEIDLALFGVEPGSFLDPQVAEGEQIAGPDEVVVSPTAVDKGVRIGDTLVLEPAGTRLKVVGELPAQSTFGHVDVAYLPLPTWRRSTPAPGPVTGSPRTSTTSSRRSGCAGTRCVRRPRGG